MIVNGNDVSRWFGEYLNAFAACGRGEGNATSLLVYYGVPLLLATDDGFVALTSDDQVVAVAKQQIDGMRAANHDHSDVLNSNVTVLNATSAIYRGEFSRVRGDGIEISRLTVSYLVTDGRLAVASQRRRYIAPDPGRRAFSLGTKTGSGRPTAYNRAVYLHAPRCERVNRAAILDPWVRPVVRRRRRAGRR